MPAYRQEQFRATAAAAAAAILLFGCAGGRDSSHSRGRSGEGFAAGPLARPEQDLPVATVVDARPAALINGEGVLWGDLRGILSEMAGGRALEEYILDQRVTTAARDKGISAGEEDVARERDILLAGLSEDPDVAARLLTRLRDRQGLGPQRFQKLLERNALLRTLVQADVEVPAGAARTLYERRYGARWQARLIVVPSLTEAQEAIDAVRSGELFADVAVERSTDSSAPRGGLLEAISRADPAYPEALRQALWSLRQGELSPPVLLDGQYAVLLLVREIEADSSVAFDDVSARLTAQARREQEQVQMDRLVRRLTTDVAVAIFDEQLEDSWARRRREARQE